MMRLSKLLIVIGIIFLPLTGWADSATDLTQVLNNLHSLQANFTQRVYDAHGNVLQQANGQMTLQRPGKFRWQTQSPSKQLLIADGRRVWFYDIDLAQATVQTQQSSNPNSPALLLSGSTEALTHDFIINSAPSALAGSKVFILQPHNNNGLFKSVNLAFNKEQKLQTMRLVDNLGQTTVVIFSHVKNNPPLAANLFHFTPPKGVAVVSN